MSEHICVQFEIRDMVILRDTLKELGYDFKNISEEVVEIQRPYHNICINGDNGTISFDNVNTKEVNKLKQTYQLNYYRDQAIKEGMNMEVTQEANGEIVLNLLHQ